jgi:hypothetical protein
LTNRNCKRARTQQRLVSERIAECDADTFFNVLTSQELLDCVEAQAGEYRERLYPPTQTLAMFMAQVLHADRSCQRSVTQLANARLRTGLSQCSTATASYCRARQRLALSSLRALLDTTGRLASERGARVALGRTIKLIDGATVSMPDTTDNQGHFPQPDTQTVGVGFPLARLVVVLCLGSGAVRAVAVGPYQGKESGEHGLLRTLLESFSAGDLVIADRYYASYFLIAALQARSVDVLFAQHAARHTDFRQGERLGINDHLVNWRKPQRPEWMSVAEYASYPATLAMREVQAHGHVLVTTLRCAKDISCEQLAKAYAERWHVELDLRAIKTTLGMEVLSCKSAAMIHKEIVVYLLAYNLIRVLMTEAAHHEGIDPRHLSFKHTVQSWLAWQDRDFIAFARDLKQRWLFYRLIASKRVGQRPGRIEPRAIKRRPKPRALLTEPRSTARRRIARRYRRAVA